MTTVASEPSAARLAARLESQVLDEYKRTARDLNDIATIVQRLSGIQPQLLAELRPLERKLGLVLTLFKASVWALLRERELVPDEEDEQA
ncbi:hypothetical protein BMF94_2651 [Rhodotorula taiwanensis]|uniref:DASH complex subunit DAD3 n=1 Tax=Rhodotorula taiwanensis TaxID=741276 RepID=A0A2S5BBU0_9BASI|nr:hypothetical protein BMF94_2651 [Rhodotorula taiwanensis]